jgi:hypothetical protein
MAATPQQADAIKLIGEWCKWFSTLETAAIAGIAAFLKVNTGQTVPIVVVVFCTIAVMFFLISIFYAAIALVSLPEAITDINEDEPIWGRPATLLGYKRKMYVVVYWQLFSFFGGVAAFVAAVISFAWTHK